MRVLLVGVAVVFMSGCGTTFCKPGASTSDFESDKYNCALRARQMAQFGDVYNPFEDVAQQNACLRSKGWRDCK